MPEPTRLALEMVLRAEQEHRAVEGELWILEHAWKEADEIAAISDLAGTVACVGARGLSGLRQFRR